MRTSARAVPDFAGVALADILANGVAMLIIVIVLTLNARYEQEQKQLEQVDEVSVMLSRQLATSIVMNRLSSSPPARLHDYEASPLDRVRNQKILPILELHREFVRDFYSGQIYSRDEMLFEENALDNFIVGFTASQKQRLRVDIYEVRLFYIAMSILKDHGIVPRHWHFLEGGGMGIGDAGFCPGGTAGGDCGGLGGDAADAAARNSLRELLAKQGQGEGEGETSGQNAGEQGADDESIGQGAGESGAAGEGSGSGSGTEGALAGQDTGQGGEGAFPPDGAELGWGGPGSSSSERYQNESVQGSGGQGEGAAEEGLFEQLMQSMTQSPAASGARSANSGKVKFRWSAPESGGPTQSVPRAGAAGLSAPLSDVLNYRAVLSGLLEYMRQVQSVLDAGGSPRQLVVKIGEKVGELMKNTPQVRPEDVPRIESLAWHFRGYWPTDDLLYLRRFQGDLSGDSVLIVPVNTGLDTVALGVEDGASSYGPPVSVRLRVNLSEYPGIYRGLAKELEPDAVLLMPPDADAPEEFRWRVLTYVSPRLDDFVLAFVYAAFDRDGNLLLDVQANQVRVDGGTLRGQPEEKLFGWRGWLVALYSLLVAALASFPLLLLRSRRRQRQQSVAESAA